MTIEAFEPGLPSFSHWIRSAITRIRASREQIVTLFESSVPEPVELLRHTVAEAFADPVTPRYTSAFVKGNPFVLDTLARRYAVPSDHIICTTGATGALSLLYAALLEPGDRVLVENPGFDLFHVIARHQGYGVDYFQRRGRDFAVDPDEIAARIGPRTKLVVLSDLHNPSGMMLGDEALGALGRMAERLGVRVIVDEVYGDYADATARPRAAAQISPGLISLSSLTKIYGLSTLRCGWIVAAPETIDAVRAVSDEIEFGVSNLAHAVAALVLENPDPFTAYWRDLLARARPILESYHAHWQEKELLLGDLPEFGCISFPRLIGIDDSTRFSEWMADRCGLIVAPGEYFGASGHIRIGHAKEPADLDCALDALTDGLKAYRDAKAMPRAAAGRDGRFG